MGNGDGTFKAAVNYAVGLVPLGVAVGDFNNDGKLDLVTANGNLDVFTKFPLGGGSVSVLLGNGDGTFGPAVNYAVGVAPTDVAVGDFNKDGHPDVVVPDALDGVVMVLLGTGNGTFAPSVSYAVESVPEPSRWEISTTTAIWTSSP